MELGNGFSFNNSFAVGVILVVLVFSSLRFVPSCGGFSSVSFLVVNSKGEYIHENFVSIQEAINAAENGSIILVPSGTYPEHVVINKTISLISENVSTTIIDGSNTGTVVKITVDNVTITGFTVQNSGWGWYRSGIETQHANNCRIENNVLFHTCHNIRLNGSRDCLIAGNKIDHINQMGYGIRLTESTNCTVSNNFVAKNIGGIVFENSSNCMVVGNNVTRNSDGIRLYSSSSSNKVFENNVFNNSYCGMIYPVPDKPPPQGNFLFHNNFINNTNPFIIQSIGNIWDDDYPSGGNYWSIYNGTDANGDGIGDAQYAVSAYDKDRYPLIHPYGSVRNLNANLAYLTIQSAINAPETLNGHAIFVRNGKYDEHVVVNKSISLVGENQTTTIIDGGSAGTVLTVNADNVSVTGFTIRNSGLSFPPYGDDYGVLLDHCAWSNISHNIVTDNRIGIYLFYSRNNIIEKDFVSSNHVNGIWLYYSGNNVLAENRISNNSYNFGVFGDNSSDFNNTIDVSNTVEEKPIQYLIGVEDKIFDNQTDIGVLYLINCNNVTVRDLDLTKNGHSVFCYNVTHSKIENVTAAENNYGICLQDSAGDIVDNNHCLDNWVGVSLLRSNYNVFENNFVQNNEKGFSFYNANYNNLSGNTILNNLYGVRFSASSFNEVFHNNLVGNNEQVNLINSYMNVWDNGFEGNFWSNYTGSDADRDGLGDIDQIIDDNNHDRHPLLGAFHNFSVYHEGNFYSVAVISNSTMLNFAFEAVNHTIRLTVNSTDETYGFSRICIPHALIEPEIAVIIDDGLTEVLYPNYTLRDDGFCRWIYFAYQHSAHEILIIPEFWSMIFLSTLMVITLWYLFFRKLEMKLRLSTLWM
jgi:parallel beta-helix repeat protein